MLKAFALKKTFRTVVAVDGVSLEVGRGEILGLLGPNGAGKTTSIRMILNVIEPDEGRVTFDGLPFSDAIRNSIGYLPEERGLYRKNLAINVLVYFGGLHGMSVHAAKEEAGKWLGRFDLLQYANRKVDELSKGNQQKLQFIATILHDPQLLVLDEPFAGLDPVNQIVLKDVLMEMKGRGKAIIFSTHQMEQAEKLSDKICLINKGKAVLQGDLHEVKRGYGKNSVHVEFEGNGASLSAVPGVKRSLIYENYAELELEGNESPGDLLRRIVGQLDIRKFEVVEPSLQSIFLSLVGGDKLQTNEKKESMR
jgi:ABC-2 type transport system ATP-binding protein